LNQRFLQLLPQVLKAANFPLASNGSQNKKSSPERIGFPEKRDKADNMIFGLIGLKLKTISKPWALSEWRSAVWDNQCELGGYVTLNLNRASDSEVVTPMAREN